MEVEYKQLKDDCTYKKKMYSGQIEEQMFVWY